MARRTVPTPAFFVQSEFVLRRTVVRRLAAVAAQQPRRRLGCQRLSHAMALAQDYQPDPVTMVAYHRAVGEHADSLLAYSTRLLGDSIAAEDVTQDAFLALYRHLNQVPVAAFRPWLFRVARNLCLDQLRRRKFKLRLFRDLQREEDQPFTPADSGSVRPDEVAETREANAAIEKAIGELPLKFREAFLLCEVEGLSYEDAAAVMGCPVKTVSTRLFRARARFKSLVSRLIKV
jgi:RNA polymerase sigma-70 factor (ECF subfamily)